MANATWAIPSFLGGEISAFAQGRFDKPDYKVSLNVCLNSFPVEIGAWTRRPGTRHAGTTRAGFQAKVMKFDFEQSNAVTLEFTDIHLRFRSGVALIPTNDTQSVVSISSATPAILQTGTAIGWITANGVTFNALGVPLLQNRQFFVIPNDASHYQLYDELFNPVDGSTLAGSLTGATVSRIHELITPYVSLSWANVRSVQAETTSMLLHPTVAPQALTVATLPSPGVNPVFALAGAVFNDGPYLDPFISGVQATPGAKWGIITLSISFPAWDSVKAYAAGAFVTSSSVNYVSLTDQNSGNTPVSSPTFWAVTSPSAAINNGAGFLGTDIGRLVRLYSEPAAWSAGSTYAAGAVISYNPTGAPGAATYWQSAAGTNIGNIPGTDLTHWALVSSGAAIWTWGKITSLTNLIDRALAGSASIGDMASGGGINAAFNGAFSQATAASAERSTSGVNTGNVTLSSFVGKNYSGASDQKIQSVTVYPSSDGGFVTGTNISVASITFNLRGKASAPASSSDGTLLATTGGVTNSFSAITIISGDQTTAWKYAWVEQITVVSLVGTSHVFLTPVTYSLNNVIAQLSFFNPPGSGISSGVNVQVLGPPLLYTTPISTWRLGVYSGTTGYPTCGTYHEGRLWLGGAVPNRFDASVSNGIVGGVVNFAPTDQNGAVAANAAISYTLNSDGVNPMFWMKPDLQGVVIGTQAGEWLVQAPTNGPISPTNIAARRMTKHGSSNIDPARTENANIFVKRYARKLLEYFADAYSGKYSAPNLADKAEHLVTAGIAELAYVEAVTPIVWLRDALGALIGMTYRRTTISTQQPPDFYAWHPHTLGSGRVVESICAGPSVGGDLDALTMVTNDPVTNIRHVEVMTDAGDEDAALADAWFLDDAVTPTSTVDNGTGLTINGLWHLNGKTVQVFVGGADCGDRGDHKTTFTDYVVAQGSVTVPYGDGVIAGPGAGQFTAALVASGVQIVVGFTYNSDGQLVRPIAATETGSRSGPALGLIRRNHRYAMLINSTRGLSVGGSFETTMYPVQMKNDRGDNIPALSVYSGIVTDPVNDTFSYEGGLCWRVSRPFPANIIAISGNIKTQDQ